MADDLIEARFAPNIVPEMRPALGPVLLDDEGRIWVSDFRPTQARWDQARAWHVLDSLGQPLARVELPPEARVADVRGGRVALIVRDSLDVEHLRVFRLRSERR